MLVALWLTANGVTTPLPLLCQPRAISSDLEGHRFDRSEWRGWDYIVYKLRNDAVPEHQLQRIFQSEELPWFSEVSFSIAPREPAHIYAGFLSKERLNLAKNFLRLHRTLFAQVEKRFHVHRSVIAAILLVETQFGANTGSHSILYRLLRVSSVGDPINLRANFERLRAKDPDVTYEQVAARAAYLETTFYPEVLALFEIAARQRVNPLRIKGSIAGAWGIPQFLPSSYLTYGKDGDGDGEVSLFNIPDAVWSTAHYLVRHGWRDDLTREGKAGVIWHYNRSEPYVQTVLAIAEKLQ